MAPTSHRQQNFTRGAPRGRGGHRNPGNDRGRDTGHYSRPQHSAPHYQSRKRPHEAAPHAPPSHHQPLKKYRMEVKQFGEASGAPQKLLFIGSLLQEDLPSLMDKLLGLLQKHSDFAAIFVFLHHDAREGFNAALWRNQVQRIEGFLRSTKIFILRNVNGRDSEGSADLAEIVPNTLYDLGKIGMIDLAGLRIAYVSFGVGQNGYDASDIASLEASAKSVWSGTSDTTTQDESAKAPRETQIDVLLSCEYPKYVTQHTTQLPPWEVKRASVQILRLARALNPRYHIVSFGNRENVQNLSMVSPYYARPPFTSKSTTSSLITRFYSLSTFLPPNVEDASKPERKSMYACALKPVQYMTEQDLKELLTDDVTPSPFERNDSQHENGSESPRRSASPVRTLPKQVGAETQSCWFCLSNADLERHLICLERQHAYVAIPKGGLTLEHSLIIPNAHVSNYRELSSECKAEIESLKQAFHKIFFGDVIFMERALLNAQGRKTHMHIHAMPCLKKVDECIKALQEEATKHSLQLAHYASDKSIDAILEENASILDVTTQSQGFLWIELGDGSKLFCVLPARVDLLPSFARELVAIGACGLSKSQANWRRCCRPRDIEEQQTLEMRSKLSRFVKDE